jgi:hypothetical protein
MKQQKHGKKPACQKKQFKKNIAKKHEINRILTIATKSMK